MTFTSRQSPSSQPAHDCITFRRSGRRTVCRERRRQFYIEPRPHNTPGYQPPTSVRRAWDPATVPTELTAWLATFFRHRSDWPPSAKSRR